ncbi:hypothetical protein ABVT39_014421 [Epinephelus coioides]
MSEGKSVTYSLCSREVMGEDYTQRLSNYHVQEQCGAKAWGAVGLSQHIESAHLLSCRTEPTDVPAPTEQDTTPAPQQHSNPPVVPVPAPAPPTAQEMQRMFLWASMRMWGIPLKCTQCNKKMHHSGIYTKVREVIDVDSRYGDLVGEDYPRCSNCMIPVCPWSSEILQELDPSHRNKFPAVLTTKLALYSKCVTMLRPRTSEPVYQKPPPFCPLPLAQWFETVHANEILGHLDVLKGVITTTYCRILKFDSTMKCERPQQQSWEVHFCQSLHLRGNLPSNRGDLLSVPDEIGANLPEMLEEVQEDECPDVTIPQATDILFQSSFQEPTVESEGASRSPVSSPFEDSGPITTTPDSRCDPRGIPGWEAVDALAGYLVSLNRTITALSNTETAEILRLYSCLDPIDKSPTKYSLKTKNKTLPGLWRASRKRSGSAPGQQATERYLQIIYIFV